MTAILALRNNKNSTNSIHYKSDSDGNSNSNSVSYCHTDDNGNMVIAQVIILLRRKILDRGEVLLLHTGFVTSEGPQGPGMRRDYKRTDDRDPIPKLAFRS